jgi:putative hydrolase of the HAD superfamily
MKKYKHIFFDLDRTLWNFEKNALEAFKDIISRFDLSSYFPDVAKFVLEYHEINEDMWEKYRKGEIKKDFLRVERFRLLLKKFNIVDEALAEKISETYIKIAPRKTHLEPYTIELLEYLKEKYRLYIITNGFNEVQFIKMESSGIDKYFEKVYTSDNVGSKKPKPEIFAHSLNTVNAKKKESLMIGDDLEVDIIGARNYGIDQIYYNPNGIVHNEKTTFEVKSLKEIIEIL